MNVSQQVLLYEHKGSQGVTLSFFHAFQSQLPDTASKADVGWKQAAAEANNNVHRFLKSNSIEFVFPVSSNLCLM